MNAYEFCNFFDFTLNKESGIDEEGFHYEYIATDNQACFHDRTVDNVTLLAMNFDSMLTDYVDETIESCGFEYDETASGSYYEQALEWIKTSELKDTDTAEVIEVLVYPDKLTA